jgi:hypothetical protein
VNSCVLLVVALSQGRFRVRDSLCSKVCNKIDYSSLSKQFDMSIIYTQIEIGNFIQFFSLPYSFYGHLAIISYCTQLWRELEPTGLILKPSADHTWTPMPLAPQDILLMEFATTKLNKKGSTMINRCRISSALFPM